MKNSLITIIIIITALSFYSCSDEDDIKTEPEKSIEDCLEFIREVEIKYHDGQPIFGHFPELTDKVKVDTCNYPEIKIVDDAMKLDFYIDEGKYYFDIKNNQPLFKNTDSVYYTSDISDDYLNLKNIFIKYEQKFETNFIFIHTKGITYPIKFGKYLLEEDINKLVADIGKLNGFIGTQIDKLFVFLGSSNINEEIIK